MQGTASNSHSEEEGEPCQPICPNILVNKSRKDKTWSSVSNSSFIFVLDFKFWLVLVEGNKVKLKNAIKFQDLMENSIFFSPSLTGLKFGG